MDGWAWLIVGVILGANIGVIVSGMIQHGKRPPDTQIIPDGYSASGQLLQLVLKEKK
jgi:hypothetical protein